MNHEHRKIANSILARLKDGEQFSLATVRRSLEITGDLAPIGSEGLVAEIQKESQGGGEIGSLCMVADNLVRHSKKTWTTRR